MSRFVSIKKAPLIGAFFVLCTLVACEKSEVAASHGQSTHLLQYVVDGDTIVVDEDTKVRMIGINTPEMGYGDRIQEPFAKQAKTTLTALLGNGEVRLVAGKEAQDRSGRELAYVFSGNGKDVQIALLEQGLAFAIAVGENQSKLSEYLTAESKARDKGLGVWGDDYFLPQQAKILAKQRARGYRHVTGIVTRTSKSNKHFSLHLGDTFKVLIPRQFWTDHFKGGITQFINKKIVTRGWVFTLGNISGVKVYHPSMIE
ncbi:MAG: endonuclease YncB(thermonuclease family) [Gammaproteobacteria bacterium]|jgi:endonuclease YncB( thermonuclease family)